MAIVLGLLLLVTVLLGCGLVNATLGPRPLRVAVQAAFLIFNSAVVLLGYVVSAIHRFGHVGAWLIVAIAVTIGLAVFHRGPLPRIAWHERFGNFRDELESAARPRRAIFIGLAIVTAIVTAVQVIEIFTIAPVNWDSQTCHLARMAYFLQFDSLAHYDANFIAQTVHGRVGAVLFAFAYLASGRNEHFTQLIQFSSSLALAISVYAMAIELGARRIAAAVAGMVTVLLTINLLQATTTQLDLMGAAYLACGLFFLLRFNRTATWGDLLLGCIGLALSLGLKSSNLLPLPAIGLAVVLHRLLTAPNPLKDTLIGAAKAAVVFVVVALVLAGPYSYFANARKWGHIAGPQWWREKHSLQGHSTSDIARGGIYNAGRFAAELLSLDGLPDTATTRQITSILRWPIRTIATAAGTTLDTPLFGRSTFNYDKPPATNEDTSIVGPAAWLLVLPAVVFAAVRRSRNKLVWPLLAGAAVYYVIQCVAAPYDPFRGRYFMGAEIFVVPLIALMVDAARGPLARAYLGIAFTIAGSTAVSAIILPLTVKPRILGSHRLIQLTSRNSPLADIFRKYEAAVPTNATVAVAFDQDDFEYPLFGRGLTRKVYPVSEHLDQPAWQGGAQFLVFNAKIVTPQPGDVFLGQDLREFRYYLRDLHHKP